MTAFRVRVRVTPREGLLDPEGQAIQHALASLGFPDVDRVHMGRLITLEVQAKNDDDARKQVDAMCRQLLANPVTEDYTIEMEATA